MYPERLYGFIESYSHHSSNHRYEYYKKKRDQIALYLEFAVYVSP